MTCGLNPLSLDQLNSIKVVWEGEMFEKLIWVISEVRPVGQTGVECWLAAAVSSSEGEKPSQTDQQTGGERDTVICCAYGVMRKQHHRL